MSEILLTVSMVDPQIMQSTDHYIEDLFVNKHLVCGQGDQAFDQVWAGIEEAQPLESTKALGLLLQRVADGELAWCQVVTGGSDG